MKITIDIQKTENESVICLTTWSFDAKVKSKENFIFTLGLHGEYAFYVRHCTMLKLVTTLWMILIVDRKLFNDRWEH